MIPSIGLRVTAVTGWGAMRSTLQVVEQSWQEVVQQSLSVGGAASSGFKNAQQVRHPARGPRGRRDGAQVGPRVHGSGSRHGVGPAPSASTQRRTSGDRCARIRSAGNASAMTKPLNRRPRGFRAAPPSHGNPKRSGNLVQDASLNRENFTTENTRPPCILLPTPKPVASCPSPMPHCLSVAPHAPRGLWVVA